MRYALIGCGRVAPHHLQAAKTNSLDLVAVCDIDPAHVDALFDAAALSPEERAGIRRYENWRELLEKERPDLVSVALPSGLHFAAARDALESGANVIVEKPVSLSLKDANELIRLAKEKGLALSACHQNRFNLSVQEMRRRLENGDFGALSNAAVTVRWSRDRDYYDQANWRGTWEMDGGCLMNQCIHGIDLLLWMCGPVKSVYAKTRRAFHPYIEAEDLGTAVFEFENGTLATVEGTVNLPEVNLEEHLTLVGSKGVMKLGGTSANTVEFSHFSGGEKSDPIAERTANVYGNGHVSLFKDVIAAVKEGRAPYVTGEDGRNALAAVLAVYLSAKTGLPVSDLPEDLSTLDFCGVFPPKEE